jgi:D-sedoheptulose 7-phosphate isomerase
MRMVKIIEQRMQESVDAKERFRDQVGNIQAVSDAMVSAMKSGNKVLICGNGGSASDAQHITGELVGRFQKERKGLPAIALTTDTSVMTAWCNDYDFSTIFSRQVEALAKPGDVIIGISTSGNSDNVIKAFVEGKKIGTVNISMTGRDGGRLKPMSDYNINSDSSNTARVQECHILAYHIICELVENGMTEE